MWTALSVLYAAELELLDAAQFSSPDFDAGGTWAPSDPVIVGGDGIHVTGLLLADNLTGTITGTVTVGPDGLISVVGSSGHVAAISCGAFGGIVFLNSSVATWQSGALLGLQSGSSLVANSGATINFQAGSGVTLAGSTTFPSGASLSQVAGAAWALNGTTTVGGGSAGFLTLGALGVLTCTSGSKITGVLTGDTFQVKGTVTVQGAIGDPATLAIGTNASITVDATSAIQLDGTLSRDVNKGVIEERPGDTPGINSTFDPSTQDIWNINVSASAEFRLSAPASGKCNSTSFVRWDHVNTHPVVLKDDGTSAVIAQFPASVQGSSEVWWDPADATWKLKHLSGDATP